MVGENPIQDCKRCGAKPHMEFDGYAWSLVCPCCYDGAEDAPNRYEYGLGWTRSEAIDEWNEVQS